MKADWLGAVPSLSSSTPRKVCRLKLSNAIDSGALLSGVCFVSKKKMLCFTVQSHIIQSVLMQYLPLFGVKFDLTQPVLKTLSQSADAIDKNDRSNIVCPLQIHSLEKLITACLMGRPYNGVYDLSGNLLLRPCSTSAFWLPHQHSQADRNRDRSMRKKLQRGIKWSDTSTEMKGNPYSSHTGMCCCISPFLSVMTFCLT